MKTTTELTATENTVSEFIRLVNTGIAAWTEAGKVLVCMIEHNPNIKRKICQEHKSITPGILAKLESVGRGSLDPQLLISDAPQYNLARKLPISDQKTLLETSIPLVIKSHDGTGVEVLHVDFKSLNTTQARQLFASDHIRDEQEQRLYLESQKQKDNAIKKDWVISNGTVTFRKGVHLTAGDLSRILASMATTNSEAA